MKLAGIARMLGAELHPASTAGPVSVPGPGPESSPEIEILGVAGIESAGPHEITFLANPKYAPSVRTTRAAAVLVEPEFPPVPLPTLRIANPYLAFARALALFHPAREYPAGIHPTAVVDPSASIGEQTHLGPFVVIGPGARVGPHSVLLAHVVVYPGAQIGAHFFAHSHAVVREHCIVGDHVTLQNGAMVGTDGFGFAKISGPEAEAAGAWHKIPQTGPAVLEDWVEVQALACIDRASVGETRIGRGAKIDNLVQVGHGSTVGADTLLCAQVGLAGSTHIGRKAILAGQAGVAGHCTLGDGVILTAQSGSHGDIPAGAMMSGSPAFPNRQWLRSTAAFQRLPETLKKLQKTHKDE